MSITPYLLIASVLLLTLAPAAEATETFGCHSWEIFVGDRQNGAGVSTDDGAVYAGAAGFYAVSDGPPVVNPWVFSIWIADENNDEPGYQRGDPACDDTSPGGAPDCFLSCTF